ncbi:DUF4179 domain-containing protein [Agathobaculum sp.]|uniref:DUF4179 domain-containing protein n=1 Tax=Agathobaculum sp. TaxID=2048138 RepID=UPI002A8179E7|nr:DUF4179 domain-containing protein [Agathobaculum sp.]MDY3617568.1 DUF4179 domain-containing protein [Agathobaculum sp.]
MNRYTDMMGRTSFTDEEKNALSVRLRHAAQRQGTRRPIRVTRRAVCVAAVATAVCIAGAAAAPTIVRMAQGSIGFFNGTQDSLRYGSQAVFEQFSSAVGSSLTHGGVTLTIDNIALDDSYLGVFFTASSDQDIRSTDIEAPEHWLASWAAPSFTVKADGEELRTPGNLEIDARYVDEHTLTGMQRLALPKLIGDTVDLVLTAPSVLGEEADWRFALTVDKSAAGVQSLSAEPMQEVDFGGRRIRIDKVSISPLGNTITISEQPGKDEYPSSAFALRDDKGNYLPVIDNGLDGTAPGQRAVNTFSFAGASTDIKSLTLVPIEETGGIKTASSIDQYPIAKPAQPGAGYYQIDKLEIGGKRAVATISTHGFAGSVNPELTLLDESGEDIAFSGDVYMDQSCDPKTGIWTVTLYYPDATAAEVAKIKQAGLWQMNAVLDESGAATVSLQ